MSDLPVLDARAAFVDVGSEQMHVSVAGGPPQVFGAVTAQLQAGTASTPVTLLRCLTALPRRGRAVV